MIQNTTRFRGLQSFLVWSKEPSHSPAPQSLSPRSQWQCQQHLTDGGSSPITALTYNYTLSQGFHSWDQCSQTMMSSSTTAGPVFESRANQPAQKKSPLNNASDTAPCRHLLSFAMSTREATLSCSTSAERAFASPQLHRACPCCKGEHKAGDDRGTNLVFLSRNT